jgi:ubiquinone/menaquinone biosynthesis C-methylase UbiE
MIIPKVWRFDHEVAKEFDSHAYQHIPHYQSVIEKSVDLCRHLLQPDSVIIDVGCATGQTLKYLSAAGFSNLVGVDSSQPMLDQCKVEAKLICSDQFPAGSFDAVLCNWTLHFIDNKKEYLSNIYNQLNNNGLLIISDKTSEDPLPTKFYHDFKRHAGVSDQMILEKAQSLQDVMHINDPEWYLRTLKNQGFKSVYIADADWCFTTFVCIK